MIVSAEFVAGVVAPGDFPAERLPEVALVGRSNVGKSSLINALARRRIARTSRAPGRTRTVNVYRIRRGTAPAVYLVDLPGYGYARAPRAGAGPGSRSPAERRRAAALEFDRMLQAYFGRPGARGALLLVDARHPGLDADLEAWSWLRTVGCACSVVGTKADTLTRAERVRRARELESVFAMPVPLVSAHDGEGLDELWKLIARLPNPTAA